MGIKKLFDLTGKTSIATGGGNGTDKASCKILVCRINFKTE